MIVKFVIVLVADGSYPITQAEFALTVFMLPNLQEMCILNAEPVTTDLYCFTHMIRDGTAITAFLLLSCMFGKKNGCHEPIYLFEPFLSCRSHLLL